MAHPDQPVFRPERLDEETVRTHYLELSGELSKIDLVAELDFIDGYPVAAYYDDERRLLPLLSDSGTLSLYSCNDPEIPPRKLHGFDLELGPLRHAAIGPLYEQETAAVVVPESQPDQFALLALTDGGQFMNPEVMNVFRAPNNVELLDPSEITAIDFRPQFVGNESVAAIAYGRDVIIYRPGSRPGYGIPTEREREANRAELERLSQQIHGRPLADVDADIWAEMGRPRPNPDDFNVYRQPLRATHHRRLPEPVVAVSIGSWYGRYSFDVLYALDQTGRGWRLGIDHELCEPREWPKPSKATVVTKFDAGGEQLHFLEESSVGGLLTGGGGELWQTFGREGGRPLSRVRLAGGRAVTSIQSTRRHTLIGSRETNGPGGTLTVIDRHAGWQ